MHKGWSSNLSTQLRGAQARNTECLLVPATVADPRQWHDSEQIRVATIALDTEHENTRNLQEVGVSQRRTCSYLAS